MRQGARVGTVAVVGLSSVLLTACTGLLPASRAGRLEARRTVGASHGLDTCCGRTVSIRCLQAVKRPNSFGCATVFGGGPDGDTFSPTDSRPGGIARHSITARRRRVYPTAGGKHVKGARQRLRQDT